MKEYSIASIAGDGIGKEVVPEAQKNIKRNFSTTSIQIKYRGL